MDTRDRRSNLRHPVNRIAKILCRAGTPPRECLITDVSDGGIRLHAERIEVTDAFSIWLANERRECKVVWRLGHEIGAQFIDTRQQGFAHRLANVTP